MNRTLHRMLGVLLGTAALTAGALAGTAQAGGTSHTGPAPLTVKAYQAKAQLLSRELSGHRLDVHRADDGAPVPGLLVVFTTSGSQEYLCRAYTDLNGTAECDAHLPSDLEVPNALANGYEARFGGNGTYAPIDANGTYGVSLGDI
ncbi:hypothetical protein GCM10010145_13930 [Streptomyces ruber]|uniref:Uncharacterized protein n=2 Tax=Streptomyces TaxID=1883 RepID=A0A918B8Q9_9ACTN|nr:hypothetical protein [Streptomyces ruber]GGQ46424.1 hypothetical protein GCM10010145_13930 [Streptomyces ruber]